MKRRQFISASASAVAGANLIPCITGSAYPDQMLFLHQGRTEGYTDFVVIEKGLKISRIETFALPEVAMVRITTDSGVQGWGQISTYNADIAATILHRNLAGYVLGQDPAEIDMICDTCIEMNHKYPWSYICRALGGIDTAIWDLYGRIKMKPVCELLGGSSRPFPVYGSSMSRSIGPEDEARRFKELRDTKGVQAFKFRIGTSTGRDRDAWPGRTEGMITTLGSSLSGSCSLFADGNSCYTPSQAIDAGRMLENNGIVQFEEPCPYWELEWTRLVTEALHLKVTGGEQDNDLAQWRRMIQMKAVDIVQPDILYAGGLTRALRIAGMAREAGMSCIPHSANHCLVTVFTLHMMRAIPNAGEFIEFSIENEEAINKTAKELFTPHLEISDGCINLSPEPGWGIQVNESWLQTAAYQKSELPV